MVGRRDWSYFSLQFENLHFPVLTDDITNLDPLSIDKINCKNLSLLIPNLGPDVLYLKNWRQKKNVRTL